MSTVPAQLVYPTRARSGGLSGMPRPLAAIAASAVLALALGAALLAGLAGGGSAVAPILRSAGTLRKGLYDLPSSAQAPISAALGADDPAYRMIASGGGLAGATPSQHLSERFDRAGVRVDSGATRFGFSLHAVGYGSSLRTIGSVAPRIRGNRVLYRRGGVEEWYVNGPLGLEQGFTIRRAPAASPTGPLTLSMTLLGGAHASLASDGRSVTFSHAGGPPLLYGGLSATDARGRVLRSWLAMSAGQLLVRVDARGARYPLRIDPLIHQGGKLIASGLVGPYGYVGQSVALSANGNTALIGAPADNEYKGAAFVFTRSGSTWAQQGEKLTGSGTVGEAWFGESVALSADGNTALIGGPTDTGALGAAWVFTRSGSKWAQQGQKLTGGSEIGAGYFGKSVALSADGNTALIGGYDDNEHHGAAWAYTRSGSTWAQQGEKLTGGGGLGFFGWSVGLSGDGNTALVGEWGLNDGVGAAWVFTRSGATWKQPGQELPPGGASGNSWFGYSVAISADGNTALIGAPHGNSYAGSASVFTRSGATWAPQGEGLAGREEVGEGELGYSAALSADGNTALLGGRVDNTFHGAAWAFQRTGSIWTHLGEKLTGSEETINREEFGWSVALSSSGATALAGSPCDSACVGSASVFASSPPEYGRCVKVAIGTGDYGSATCASLGGKKEYEWDTGALKVGFTTKLASGVAKVETVKGAKVTCKGQTGTGDYTGHETVGGVLLTLTGCERSSEKCSSGLVGGEIVSKTLEGVLGVEKLGTTSSRDKIGLDLFPTGKTGPVMEFACGSTAVSIRGSVIVPVASNKMSSTAVLRFAATAGKQKPEGFVGGATDVLEASFGGGPFEQAGLTLLSTQTNEEPLEINPVV